ncbi:hypothetical protein ESCO106017_25190 [Escherichia coli]
MNGRRVSLLSHIRISILFQKLLAVHALHGFTMLCHRINRFGLRGCFTLLYDFSLTHGGFVCGLTSATISGNRAKWSPHRCTKSSTVDCCVSHALPRRHIHSGGLTQRHIFLVTRIAALRPVNYALFCGVSDNAALNGLRRTPHRQIKQLCIAQFCRHGIHSQQLRIGCQLRAHLISHTLFCQVHFLAISKLCVLRICIN